MQQSHCSFWYIHSFILDNLDFEKFANCIKDKKSNLGLKLKKFSRNNEIHDFASYINFTFDELVFKDSEEPKDGLDTDVSYSSNSSIPCTIKNTFHVELTGLCSHIIELTVRPEYTEKIEIEDLINLSNIFEIKNASFNFSSFSNNPDNNFKKKEYHPTEFSILIFRSIVNLFKTNIDQSILWIDDPNTRYGVSTNNSNKKFNQTPYVVSILGYDDVDKYHNYISKVIEQKPSLNTSKNMAEKDDEKNLVQREIASLLYRFKTPEQWKKVDLSYISAFSSRLGGGFENLHLHEDIFVTMHLRSVVVLYNQNACKANDHPALLDFYLPALQATLADARANWFGFVLVNSYIDDFMQKLRLSSDMKPSKILQAMIALRKRVMGLLNSTVSHKRASGSLSEIYRRFYELFGVRALRQDALTKIDLLEKVYANKQHLAFLQSSDEELY